MLKVRLSRAGAKKRPFYHIVVAPSANARDGRFLEQVGIYDPAKPMAEARIKRERLDHWLSVGAKPSETVAKVLREHRKAMEAAQAGS